MNPQSILDALDLGQQRVATEFSHPVAVLAGAGSGKTRAITHRIAYAVATRRYAPKATLAITFTTRAAGEMRERFQQLATVGVQARTIHAAALRQAAYFWPSVYGVELPNVLSAPFPYVARACSQVVHDPSTALIRDVLTEISWAKANNLTPSTYADLARDDRIVSGMTSHQIASAMVAYERLKQGNGYIDFADILLCTAALLSQHDEVARQVNDTYKHFVVDEFQDISPIQHTLIKLWVGESRDVCVVGDVNQAIHSFAGANARYLRDFTKDWPDAVELILNTNYRSTPNVLGMANTLIPSKVRLAAVRTSGPQPRLARFNGERDEADGVVTWLRERHDQGTPWSQLSVLYRINAQAPTFEAALADANIPYTVRDSAPFYERPEIRQALHLLTKAAQVEGATSAQIDAALTQSGWATDAPLGHGAVREKWESLDALRTLTLELFATYDNDLSMAVSELAQRAQHDAPPTEDSVTLATIHSSKGLEWDGVAIVGVREGLIPFSMAESQEAIAEERRLLYVGITRARTWLHISWANSKGRGRSRFLAAFAEHIETTSTPRPNAKKRTCSQCKKRLSDPLEIRLRRHVLCEVSIDTELEASLKEWRLVTAKEASVPAFVVFTDSTLQAIAEAMPSDLADLLAIPGIGKVKAERYGPAVIDIVAKRRCDKGVASRDGDVS